MKNQFAARLSAYRNFCGESQAEFADALSVKLRTLRTWEQGIHNCSFDDLIAICNHYGITSDWLLGLVEDDSPFAAKSQVDMLTGEERRMLSSFQEFLAGRHRK